MSPPKQTFYAILGVKEDATPREIKAAYHKLILNGHQDESDDGEESSDEEPMTQMNRAYEVFSDDEKRVEYHRQLKRQRSNLFDSIFAPKSSTSKACASNGPWLDYPDSQLEEKHAQRPPLPLALRPPRLPVVGLSGALALRRLLLPALDLAALLVLQHLPLLAPLPPPLARALLRIEPLLALQRPLLLVLRRLPLAQALLRIQRVLAPPRQWRSWFEQFQANWFRPEQAPSSQQLETDTSGEGSELIARQSTNPQHPPRSHGYFNSPAYADNLDFPPFSPQAENPNQRYWEDILLLLQSQDHKPQEQGKEHFDDSTETTTDHKCPSTQTPRLIPLNFFPRQIPLPAHYFTSSNKRSAN